MDFLKALALGSSRAPKKEQKAMSPAQALGIYYTPGQPVRKYDFDPDQAAVKGFKACVWVFACASLLMRAVGSVPWRMTRRNESETGESWEPIPDKRADLIEFPNDEMTRNFAMSWMTSHLVLNGEAPIKLARLNDRDKTVTEMYPLHPHRFSPIAGEGEYVSAYEMYERGVRKVIPKEEIIFVKLPDPDNIMRGCGLLQAAWKSVLADNAAQEWRANLMERGGIPPGAIKDDQLISDTQLEEASDLVEKAWGKSAKGGRPMVIGAGTEWIPFSYNATDLQFLENREFTVREICTAFGFHPALFSNEAATYDNLRSAIRHYWKNGAIPLLDTFRDAFNLGLVRKEERRDLFLDYDLSGVEALQEDTASQVATFAQAIASGMSRAEAASVSRISLAKTDGDDVPLIGAALRPLADVAAGDAGLNDPMDDLLPKVAPAIVPTGEDPEADTATDPTAEEDGAESV